MRPARPKKAMVRRSYEDDQVSETMRISFKRGHLILLARGDFRPKTDDDLRVRVRFGVAWPNVNPKGLPSGPFPRFRSLHFAN